MLILFWKKILSMIKGLGLSPQATPETTPMSRQWSIVSASYAGGVVVCVNVLHAGAA